MTGFRTVLFSKEIYLKINMPLEKIRKIGGGLAKINS